MGFSISALLGNSTDSLTACPSAARSPVASLLQTLGMMQMLSDPRFSGFAQDRQQIEQAAEIIQAMIAMVMLGRLLNQIGVAADSFQQKKPAMPAPEVASQGRNLDVFTPYTSGPMHLGHSGDAVAELQALLNSLGADLEQDGLFGPKTEAALRSFQSAIGLSPTGIVDAETLQRLQRHSEPLTPEQWHRYAPDYDRDLGTLGADRSRVLDSRVRDPHIAPGMGVKTLLDEIAEGEGTSDAHARSKGYQSGYDVTLGFGAYVDDKSRPLTSMTLGEVKALQRRMLANPRNRWDSSAVGRYQIVGKTLRGIQRQMGLSDNERFTPELQDRMAMHLLKARGLERFQAGRLSAAAFQNNLAMEWASVARSDSGRSHYAGQGTGTSAAEIRVAMDAARANRART